MRPPPPNSGSIVEIGNAVMCWGYLISGGRGCGTLFRVPRETPAQGKEMILWVSYIDRILFSIDE